MAISDPTMSVPTPTGILQGVAAFNWDGAAWQPSGRAGPGVATPTGNLQGVAAFTGGPSWAPTGRAGPGVATPTGVLDGVAVYTWSGSQWTPPGGQPAPSTPSGALRGVAAFDWDGAAWQPVGQAGPDVATPYGVLQGVARFGWTGSVWAATGAPSLSLDFMTPGTLDSRITFTRASTATYTDASGTIQMAAINAPRWDYDPVTHASRGLLIEEARTNVCFPSTPIGGGWVLLTAVTTAASGIAPDNTNTMVRLSETATSGFHINYLPVTTAASVASIFSVYAKAAQNRYLQLVFDDGGANSAFATFDLQSGTVSGPLTSGGTATIGAASIQPVGNGTYRCAITATIAATSARALLALSNVASPGQFPSYLGNTANGLLVWGAQVEQGAFGPTSYIVTTGVTATRAVDTPSLSVTGAYVPPGGSWFAEYIRLNPPSGGFRRIITISPGINASQLMSDDNGTVCQFDGAAIQTGSGTAVVGAVVRGVSTWTSGQAKLCQNGGTVATSASLVNGYPTVGPVPIFTNTVPADSMTGYIRRLSYWPRVLSSSEMQAVTA